MPKVQTVFLFRLIMIVKGDRSTVAVSILICQLLIAVKSSWLSSRTACATIYHAKTRSFTGSHGRLKD